MELLSNRSLALSHRHVFGNSITFRVLICYFIPFDISYSSPQRIKICTSYMWITIMRTVLALLCFVAVLNHFCSANEATLKHMDNNRLGPPRTVKLDKAKQNTTINIRVNPVKYDHGSIVLCFAVILIHGVFTRTISQGAVSIRETVLPGMAILMLKIRRPNGRLIFNMEIAICR